MERADREEGKLSLGREPRALTGAVARAKRWGALEPVPLFRKLRQACERLGKTPNFWMESYQSIDRIHMAACVATHLQLIRERK